jgi:hypothetical protein
MPKAPEQKSTRFSRWRERRRTKAARAREIGHRVKAERSRNLDRHHKAGGDSGPTGGAGVGGI